MTETQTQTTGSRAILPIIFFAGFTFLVYEVCWNRLLALVLGATVAASTIVLATFMGGFGLGAWFWGRVGNGRRAVGRLLALLLAGVGAVSALDYPLIVAVIPRLYARLGAAGVSDAAIAVSVHLFAAVLMLAPAFLMGGVFPLASRIAARGAASLPVALGRLYAVETLGSAAGGLITGFLLLGALGQRATLACAVVVNLLLAAWLTATRRFNDFADTRADESGREVAADGPRERHLGRSALTGAFACGAAMLTLQVLWIRALRVYLTNTSYTFALVSSVSILGLFVGSLLFKRRGGGADLQLGLLRALLAMAGAAGIGLLLLVNFPAWFMIPFQSVLDAPALRVFLLPVVAALLVAFPPAVLSGYAFPLACALYAEKRGAVSRDVGLVMMVNTAGGVLGPVAAAFLLIPALGVAVSLVLVLAVLTAAATAIALFWRPACPPGFRVALLAVTATLAVIAGARPEIRILPPSFAVLDREVLFYREAVEGTLTVGRDRGDGGQTKYTYVNNSTVIGSTYDAVKVVKMVGHLPFFLGLEGRDVLVIGFGIGVTTSAIASHDEVRAIDCVELVPGLTDAAGYYRHLNGGVVRDPRLNVIAGDGRHYLRRTPRKYDLISCDPTHPILGSGSLYTAEYFELCRERLNPGGMISQYLPLHKLGPEEFQGIVATFHDVFPHGTVWLGHYHAVLLGATEPMRIDFADWSERIAAAGRDDWFYLDPYHLATTLVLDGARIAELGHGSGVNSDDRSYTEFFAPACLDEGNLVANLRRLADNRVAPGALLRNIPDAELMARYLRGNELMTESIIQSMSGERERSLITLRRARDANPENGELPFLIRFYY